MTVELPETENYFVTLGHSEEFKRDCYQIVNRNTGIIEMETTVMGYVYSGLEQLESMLNGKEETIDTGKILQ
jgi:hypothetical protein